jgi:hypothetical protein
MADTTGGPLRPHEDLSARSAVVDIDLDVALAIARAAARTLRQLSPETSDLFSTFLQREIDRLKLGRPGASDVAQMQLRQFLREG